MKQKIKEALQQGHKNLGLKDEVFERVAASVETFITDESQIDGFVKSENTLNLLKSYQSIADKLRTLETKPKPEPDPKPEPKPEPKPGPEPKPEPKPKNDDVPAWAQQLIEQNKMLAEQSKSFAEKLTAFETVQTQKSAVAALDELKNSWDYAKGYPEESEYAYKMAMGIYDGIGKTWTAEQLTAKYKETFNERVSLKGVDTTKPFKSDNTGGDNKPDFSKELELLRSEGVELPE